jgi:ERCC4-related helicase
VVVADECQRYIGNTDGYSILLSARACGSKILALSATPQLHAPERLRELQKVFDEIKVFSVEDSGIKEHMPKRLVVMERVKTPEKLLRVYRALGNLNRSYQYRIRKQYGPGHKRNCTKHGLCRASLAVKLLKFRMVEDGASSVIQYKTWKFRDLTNKRKSLNGQSIYQVYKEALNDVFNHKLSAAMHILRSEVYSKALVYVESVMGAKHLAAMLHQIWEVKDVAVLVGKGDMSMDQQASALLHFKKQAKILICTSVGEEGLDIPSADLEVWVDPPSNPRKWIQRFGRILRQPGDKKLARTFALVSMQTHEKTKLLSVKRNVEETYSFTQQLHSRISKPLSEKQKLIAEYV